MIIQSKIKRPQGTTITLFGKRYEFKPNGAGDHACEVTDPQAIERFLSVTEGYCEYKGKAEKPNQKANPVKPPVDDELDEDEIELPVKQSDEMSETEVREAYIAKFGRKPHHAMKLDNIIKAVSE